jgi:hypothetical protein
LTEIDRAAGELSGAEVDLGAGELGAGEYDVGAGESGAAEVDEAAGEHGGVEADRAAGEHGAVEVAAVEDDACEVEVQALPGHCRVTLEVRGDDPDHGVADFPAGPEGKPLRRASILPRIGLVRHAQVAAENIDAGLPVLRPVFSQARHGIHPGQPDFRRLITAQLPGRRGEPLVQGPGVLLRERLVQLLALFVERLLGVSAGGAAAGNLHSHRTGQGDDADTGGNDGCDDLGLHKRNLVQLATTGLRRTAP